LSPLLFAVSSPKTQGFSLEVSRSSSRPVRDEPHAGLPSVSFSATAEYDRSRQSLPPAIPSLPTMRGEPHVVFRFGPAHRPPATPAPRRKQACDLRRGTSRSPEGTPSRARKANRSPTSGGDESMPADRWPKPSIQSPSPKRSTSSVADRGRNRDPSTWEGSTGLEAFRRREPPQSGRNTGAGFATLTATDSASTAATSQTEPPKESGPLSARHRRSELLDNGMSCPA